MEPSPVDPRTRAASAFPKTQTGSSLADGGGYRYSHVLNGFIIAHPLTVNPHRFLKLLFTNKAWQDGNANLLHGLTKKPEAIEASIRPNQLPSYEEARLIFNLYLDGPQVQNPFLLRQDIEKTFTSVFSPDSSPTPRALFHAFMILATGSITLFRNGRHAHHSFGYYLAAMRHFDPGFMANGVSAIQDLLLICRFGVYHHTGTSIWDVVQLCVRMCIEQGLHQPPRRKLPLLEEQLQRRVFWECYMIDRYSSSTLDRPFAIADQDIATALPAHVGDAELIAASALYPDLATFESRYSGSTPNEMSVFLACIRLRQITSRIQRFASVTAKGSSRHAPGQVQLLAMGNVYRGLDELLVALDDWLASTPMLTSPKCLYEKREYFEFLHAREQLLLMRRAMEVVPKRKGVPPQHLLALSLKTATRGIELFSALFERNAITYTRSYFAFLFTAGLSIMLSVSVSDGTLDDCNYTGPSSKALVTCEDTLRRLGEKLPDAKPYVTVFEALHRNVAKGSHQKSRSTRQSTTFTPSWTSHRFTATESALEKQHLHPQDVEPQAVQSSHFIQNDRPQDQYLELAPRAAPSMNTTGASWPHSSDMNLDHAGVYGTGAVVEHAPMFPVDMTSPDEYTMFPWASLTEDNPLWSMEAGLGEYAYGDAGFNMALFQ